MNAKNRLIEWLLNAARRHKVLTYPVMALVAIISTVSNLFSWGTGAGKRVVAIVMVAVMLVSQSCFLTSSGIVLVDGVEAEETQEDLQGLQNDVDAEKPTDTNEETKDTKEETEDTSDAKRDSDESPSQELSDGSGEEIVDTTTPEEPASIEQKTEVVANDSITNEDGNGIVPAGEDNSVDAEAGAEAELGDAAADAPNEDDSDILTVVWKEISYIFYNAEGGKISISNNGKYQVPFNEEKGTVDLSYVAERAKKEAEKNENICYEYTYWYDENGNLWSDDNLKNHTYTEGETIIFKAQREIKYYNVTVSSNIPNDELEATKPEFAPQDVYELNGSGGYLVLRDGSFTIYVSRKCYTYDSVTVNGRTTNEVTSVLDSNGGATLTFNFTGNEENKNIVVNWTGNEYTIRYLFDDEPGSTVKEVQYTYGDDRNSRFETSANKMEGWTFAGWSYGTDYTNLYPKNLTQPAMTREDMYRFCTDYTDGKSVELLANYNYVGVNLLPGVKKLSFEVGEKSAYLLQGQYTGSSKKGHENFTYEITEGSGKLAEYGIIGKNIYDNDPALSGISLATDGTNKNTTDQDQSKLPTITVEIKDSSAADVQNKRNYHFNDIDYPVEYTIPFEVVPHKIRVKDFLKGTDKIYDGTTETTNLITETIDDGNGDRNIIWVTDNGKTLGITFTTSEYNDPNVGNDKIIYLYDAVVSHIKENGEVKPVDDKNAYILDTVDGSTMCIPGKIYQRVVFVKASVDWGTGTPYVRAGEDNPIDKFKAEVQKKYNVGEVQGFVPDDNYSLERMIENGEAYWTTDPEREDLTKPGEYRLVLKSKPVPESNYEIRTENDDVGKFSVIREDPVLNTHYEIDGTLGENGWYKGAVAPQISIIEKIKYDTVRLSRDSKGKNQIGQGAPMDVPDGDFSTDGLYIQLYDSKTHAVTSWQPVHVKVDIEDPELTGLTIKRLDNGDKMYEGEYASGTNPAGGKYFPAYGQQVSFGNYFNKTIQITVRCQDVTSGLDFLYYGLNDGYPGEKGVYFKNEDEGYGSATFEVPLGTDGAINIIVKDNAGNERSSAKLVRPDASDATEWVIEDYLPEIDDFYVTTTRIGADKEERIPDGSTEYYANCKVYLSAQDGKSGVGSVTWWINGIKQETVKEDQTDNNKQTLSYKFEKKIEENGECSVKAVLKDVAGNEIGSETLNFKVDDEKPVVNVKSYDEDYQQSVRIEFEAYDRLSGIESIEVRNDTTKKGVSFFEEETNGRHYCYFVTSTKGMYTITAIDKVGNKIEVPVDLLKVSSQVPACPKVTLTGQEGNDGWYKGEAAPTFTVSNVRQTEDGTPVTTAYRFWKEGQDSGEDTVVEQSKAEPIPDGTYNLEYWSKSMTGVLCENAEHSQQFKVDTKKPEIKLTSQKNGSGIHVEFAVTDYGSGVDRKTIEVINGITSVQTEIKEIPGGYSGSFDVSEATGSYVIHAADIAGNDAEPQAYNPISAEIGAEVSFTSAGLNARVTRGTFDIQSAAMYYREYPNGSYKEVIPDENENPADGDWVLSAGLDNLKEGTTYACKIKAVSVAGEVVEVESYFKTLSENGTSICGTVVYGDKRSPNSGRQITVTLMKGQTAEDEPESGEKRIIPTTAEKPFTFDKVEDGNYTMEATDGYYKKTVEVVIDGGNVKAPESYSENLQIEFVLSGMVTEYDNVLGITANMDDIFNDTEICFPKEDQKTVKDGGIVKFKLNAALVNPSDVDPGILSQVYPLEDNKKVTYLELTLTKEVYGSDGNLLYGERVTQIGGGHGIWITIPVGELTGEDLKVIRYHENDGELQEKELPDEKFYGTGTYTFWTDRFSIYVIEGMLPDDPGDNQGGDNPGDQNPPGGGDNQGGQNPPGGGDNPGGQNPPGGGDNPGDQNPPGGGDNPGDQNPPSGGDNSGDQNPPGTGGNSGDQNPPSAATTVTTGPSSSGAIQKSTESEEIEPDDPDKNNNKEEKQDSEEKKINQPSTNRSSIGSLRSSGTAKTGDETPIAVMGVMMLLAMGGIFFLKRKMK